MKENLISCVSYWDGEFLWCYDEVICALSKVNLTTLQVECILTPMQILNNGRFEVRKIIGWGNKLIILPCDIGNKWIIYNKDCGKLEQIYICSVHQRYAEAVLLEENKLILFPISINAPILVIDLLKRIIIKKINLQNLGLEVKNGMEIWNIKKDQGDICFFIQNSFFYGRLNNDGISLIKIDTSESFLCADFHDGIGWAIGNQGKHLYQFDRWGKVLNDYQTDAETEYIRIIAERNCVFLLPVDKSKLWVFCCVDKGGKEIGREIESLTIGYPEILGMPAYWDYIKEDNSIFFLPLKYPFQNIDINTLVCKEIALKYSEEFSETKYWEYCEYARKNRKIVFSENTSNSSLRRYLELIQWNNWKSEKQKKVSCAKKIWEIFD